MKTKNKNKEPEEPIKILKWEYTPDPVRLEVAFDLMAKDFWENFDEIKKEAEKNTTESDVGGEVRSYPAHLALNTRPGRDNEKKIHKDSK